MKELAKLEKIVEKTGIEYDRAIQILKEADGELETAFGIVNREKQVNRERLEVKGRELKEKVKQLIKESNVTRLRIKRGGRIMLDIPVAAGIFGTVVSPYLAAVGALAAMVTKCTIEVEREANSLQAQSN